LLQFALKVLNGRVLLFDVRLKSFDAGLQIRLTFRQMLDASAV
jgi:hypothetical protein